MYIQALLPKRLLRDPYLPDQFPHRRPHLSLLQYPYNLLHAESLLFHGISPFFWS